MKIGIVQCNLVAADFEYNAATLIAAVREAAVRGAELVMASELSLCAAPPSDVFLRECFIVESRVSLQKMADALHAESLPPLLLGSAVANPVSLGKRIHNGAVFLKGGQVIVASRKVLLPCENIYNDMRYFEAGVACGMVEYKGWRLAVAIGSDIWSDRAFWQGRRTFETDPVAEIMSGGADAIVHLAAIPYRLGGYAQYERMLSWAASRYRLPVLCANQVGGQDSVIFEGRSVCINAFGQVTGRAAAFVPDILVVDLVNPGDSSLYDPTPPMEDLWRALLVGTRDFIHKCGFKKVMLGLSGGIDSALVAAIAAKAVGPENVLGVLMPSPYTSRESTELALQLAENLGIATRIIPIGALMEGFDAALSETFARRERDVTEENIQARVRGTLLMAIANKFGQLLLSTGNKSEAAVGYCTLYGDTCGGLEVIGDLYKTQVYSLARWFNASHEAPIIPEGIITRPPSAELRLGQKDEDSLPPYEELDRLLNDYIEQHMCPDMLCEVGHDPATVKRVIALVRDAEFKRGQMPPALRVSPVAFGAEWKMPVAIKRPRG